MSKPTCEHCGGTNIVRDCYRCGAPVCCDDCCRITTVQVDDRDELDRWVELEEYYDEVSRGAAAPDQSEGALVSEEK